MDSVELASAPAPRQTARNVYRGAHRHFTIYPEVSAANPFGFVIRTEPPLRVPASYPHPRGGAPATLRAALTYPIFALKALLAYTIALPSRWCYSVVPEVPQKDHLIVPEVLQGFLILVTPPPGTFFPVHYPTTDTVRVWLSPSSTVNCIATLRANGVPETLILEHPTELTGQQKIHPGDILFVRGKGYYVSGEIGPLPDWVSWGKKLVALQTHTIDREMNILYVPSHYVAPPEMSGGVITGELDEDGEDR